MIGVSEIDFGIMSGFFWSVKEVFRKGKWVSIFFSDFVKGTIIYTKSERTIFLFDEQYRSAMRRTGWSDELVRYVFFNKFSKRFLFCFGERVDGSEGRGLTFL